MQIQDIMKRAVNMQVAFKEIKEYNPDMQGYEHIKAITYDGFSYRGKKTKVFAYMGFPEGASASSPVPAIVLVHGGGGHPYMEWVRLWNERGYAAIAMETTGYFPNHKNDGLDESHNDRFTWGLHGIFEEEGYISTPDRVGYPAVYTELEEQWPYHGLTQVILAHNILRQDERVDKENIGITGISWGGVVVSQVIGYDTRYSFAIPVYGTAYLGCEIRSFDNFHLPYTDSLWAAERNLDNAKMPIFWYAYNDDTNFCVPAYVKSYLHTEGFNEKNTLLMLGEWGHSHGAVFGTKHSFMFADWVTYEKGGFVTFDTQPQGRNVSCNIKIPKNISGDISAVLYYITEPMSYSRFDKFGKGIYKQLDQYWQRDASCLSVDRENALVSGVVPDSVRGYYIQLFYCVEGSECASSSTFVSVG